MIETITLWWRRRCLRIAHEKHAYWKAIAEAQQKQLMEGDVAFKSNPYNRNRAVHAAGKEAQYLERVDFLNRQ